MKLLLVAALYLTGSAMAPRSSLEYEVKAAFLLNFITFTEWPPTVFESPSSPLRVCVIGDDPFGGSLVRTVQGETVASHPLVVVNLALSDAFTQCHALFVPRTAEVRRARDRWTLEAPILIVGESDGLWRTGAIINFAIDGGRVRFDVNRTAAGQSGLRLSPKLLGIARVVK